MDVPQVFKVAEGSARYTLFPIQYPKLFDKYKQQESAFWSAEEIDISKDKKALNQLTPFERRFIMNTLAFFAASDGIVIENLATRFMSEVEISEARQFYGAQVFIEGIHNEMYSLLIDTYANSSEEKNKLFRAMETSPSIKRKADWAIRWIKDKKASFPRRLAAFGCVEGIFFSASFCSIYWLRQKGVKMPGLISSNEKIAGDERIHTEFAALLYSMLEPKDRLTSAEMHDMVREACEIEKFFVEESLTSDLMGMNQKLMKQYVEFVCDFTLRMFGYDELYHADNPFDWMDLTGLVNQTNFFEKRPGDYQLAAKQLGQRSTNQFDQLLTDF